MPTKQRLQALRDELKRHGYDGFMVPICDEHMSEYIAPYAKRLAWLTGFLGSAGTGIVTQNKAAVLVDGRYTLQVREQVDGNLYEFVDFPATTPADWLEANAKAGDVIAYDPWLHPIDWVEATRARLEEKGAKLVTAPHNPIDAVWTDQPPLPQAPIKPQDIAYAGRSHQDKLKDIAAGLKAKDIDACVIAALDSIAWALNIRGTDIDNTPVAVAFLIVRADGGAELFTDPKKIDADLRAHLGSGVKIAARDDFLKALDALGAAKARVLLDPVNIVSAIFDRLRGAGAKVVKDRDPCVLPKACKNPVELEGSRAAHLRDGIAVAEFLSWFDKTAKDGALTEMDAADYLLKQREKVNSFQDLSFRTISAAGPHAASPHYSVTKESNLKIDRDSVFLIDSGGQYLDGTTDITRTMAVGAVPQEVKRRFTLVLKGHIALATLRFPKGTPGRAIDVLARHALWQSGLDYDHGTGHGVGSYLAVHEGPQRIAKASSDEPLQPGMILSNEPGYYKAGEYGIRIENLVIVIEDKRPGDEREMLGFETITFAPIDLNMVLPELLTPEERAWLNDYHTQVRKRIGGQLSAETKTWMEGATRAV